MNQVILKCHLYSSNEYVVLDYFQGIVVEPYNSPSNLLSCHLPCCQVIKISSIVANLDVIDDWTEESIDIE